MFVWLILLAILLGVTGVGWFWYRSRTRAYMFRRDDGFRAYSYSVLYDQERSQRLFDDLQATGLFWYWESVRLDEGSAWNAELPAHRDLTLLDAETRPLLAADILDRNGSQNRFISLFACTSTFEGVHTVEDGRFRQALRQFVRQHAGPIQLAMIQFGDSPLECLFVPKQEHAAITQLFERWGVHNEEFVEQPYEHLNLARIESQYEQILN